MKVRPVNIATITDALVKQLAEWPDMPQDTHVSRAQELNDTPGACPWIGVYRERVEYTVKTLGYGAGFRDQNVHLVVAVQEADGTSGEKCEDRLEALVAEVLGAILNDTRILGTVAQIPELEVIYADYKKVAGGQYMQTAGVYLTAVVPVAIEN